MPSRQGAGVGSHHMEFAAKVTREGKYTLAEFPDCPGCQTFVEGRASIEVAAAEALAGWLDANLGRDLVPPRPKRHVGKQFIQVPVPAMLSVRIELRWAREEEQLTQAQLAKRIGVSQQQIQKLEGAGSNPTLETLEKVAEGLGRRLSIALG